MKILRVIARLNVGGPAIQAILLTRELEGRGHPSLLVTGAVPPEEGDMQYLADGLGVRPLLLPCLSRRLSLLGDLQALLALRRLIRRERPDLVHTHTAKAGTVGRAAALLAGVPCVHTFHGHVFDGYFPPWKTRFFLAIERRLARRTARIIAISDSQRDDLAGRYRIAPRSKFAVVRLGFDLDPFLGVAAARAESAGPLRVTWAGRLTAIKDPLLLVSIAAAAADSRFEIVGDGGMRPEVEAAIRKAGLRNLALCGWRREMAPVYAATDVLMLTSRNEGTPVAVIEAMAAGCAVVAADVGGVRDLFTGAGAPHPGFTLFDNGILVAERDAPTFAAALRLLAVSPGLRGRLGRAASAFAAAHFGRERLVAEILAVYESVLAPRGANAAKVTAA